MRLCNIVFLLAVAAPGALSARSLQDDYARLCLDPAKANPGMCRELAAALNAKGIPLPVPAPPQATETVQASPTDPTQLRQRWGVFADMMGKELIASLQLGNPGEARAPVPEVHTRMEWVVPGQKAVSRVKFENGWRDVSTTEWDPASQRLMTVTSGPNSSTSYMLVHPDGSIETPESTDAGSTTRGTTREISPGRYETYWETKKDGVWTALMRNSMQVAPVTAPPAPAPASPVDEELRNALAQRAEVARQLDARRMEREMEERQRLQDEQDAEFADREAQRVEAHAAWEAQDALDDQALQDSLDRLDATVAAAQARVRQGAGGAPAVSGHGVANAQAQGYIEIEAKDDRSPTMAPSAPSPTKSAGQSEHLMGFIGADCAAARLSAKRWVGSGGSFTVAHEMRQGNNCLVQIDLNNVQHGGGTASSQ